MGLEDFLNFQMAFGGGKRLGQGLGAGQCQGSAGPFGICCPVFVRPELLFLGLVFICDFTALVWVRS